MHDWLQSPHNLEKITDVDNEQIKEIIFNFCQAIFFKWSKFEESNWILNHLIPWEGEDKDYHLKVPRLSDKLSDKSFDDIFFIRII